MLQYTHKIPEVVHVNFTANATANDNNINITIYINILESVVSCHYLEGKF